MHVHPDESRQAGRCPAGVAHAARAHAIASAYASERIQGRGSDGAPVAIDQHVDVRQMLDDMAGLVFGCRAMAYTVLVMIESGEGRELVDFLTPVVKVFCSEAATRTATIGQQVLGGYGYHPNNRLCALVWPCAG